MKFWEREKKKETVIERDRNRNRKERNAKRKGSNNFQQQQAKESFVQKAFRLHKIAVKICVWMNCNPVCSYCVQMRHFPLLLVALYLSRAGRGWWENTHTFHYIIVLHLFKKLHIKMIFLHWFLLLLLFSSQSFFAAVAFSKSPFRCLLSERNGKIIDANLSRKVFHPFLAILW